MCAVKNHGVSEELLGAMFDRSQAFFALPMEDKMGIHINSHNRGYTRVRSLLPAARVKL